MGITIKRKSMEKFYTLIKKTSETNRNTENKIKEIEARLENEKKLMSAALENGNEEEFIKRNRSKGQMECDINAYRAILKRNNEALNDSAIEEIWNECAEEYGKVLRPMIKHYEETKKMLFEDLMEILELQGKAYSDRAELAKYLSNEYKSQRTIGTYDMNLVKCPNWTRSMFDYFNDNIVEKKITKEHISTIANLHRL